MNDNYFIWEGSPVMLELGPIVLRWYGLLFAATFLCGYFIIRKLFKDAGRKVELADTLLTYIILAVIIGARLGHVIFYDFDYYIRNIQEVLYIWRGGLASHGAAIAIVLALWLFIRKYPHVHFFWLTDRLSFTIVLGAMFVRIGNFMNSEIYGHPTEVPWAVIFARVDMIPRHPTMLYEAFLYLLILVALTLLYRYYQKHPPEGLLSGVFLVTLFTSRFFVEYTKVPQADFSENWMFDMGQLLSLPFILLGIWILWSKVTWSQRSRRTQGLLKKNKDSS